MYTFFWDGAEGRHRQNAGMTNRNHIRGYEVGGGNSPSPTRFLHGIKAQHATSLHGFQ